METDGTIGVGARQVGGRAGGRTPKKLPGGETRVIRGSWSFPSSSARAETAGSWVKRLCVKRKGREGEKKTKKFVINLQQYGTYLPARSKKKKKNIPLAEYLGLKNKYTYTHIYVYENPPRVRIRHTKTRATQTPVTTTRAHSQQRFLVIGLKF